MELDLSVKYFFTGLHGGGFGSLGRGRQHPWEVGGGINQKSSVRPEMMRKNGAVGVGWVRVKMLLAR